jgi:hypothetical protein
MISIVITSRMGNQLFQYAFIYAAARKLKTNFIVNTKEGKQGYILEKYFRLRNQNPITNRVTTGLFNWLKKKNKTKVVRQT